MSNYNGWTNKETWLVNLWYSDALLRDYIEIEDADVEAYRVEEDVRYIALECEAMSKLPDGLLSDFIETAFAEVNWQELADHINSDLEEEYK